MIDSTFPWTGPAEMQLIQLRDDRGMTVTNAVQTVAESAARALGYNSMPLMIYMAARDMVFSCLGIGVVAEHETGNTFSRQVSSAWPDNYKTTHTNNQ